MKKFVQFFKRPFRFGALYTCVLIISGGYILLDTFVIPKSQQTVSVATETTSTNVETIMNTMASTPVVTDTSYQDDTMTITITEERANDTTFYVADIQVSDPAYLKTALANNTFGRNIKETTSDMASEHNAILAINGDYYGFRDGGYVIRNGVLYRDTVKSDDAEDLVIDANGDFSIITEGEVSAQNLLDQGAEQVLSFGPALVVENQVVVDTNDEVSQSKNSNPRTAIGQVGTNHYVIIVSDGRTDASSGFSLQQLAEQMQAHGATTAYNLDGGGSSTLWFNGQVVNVTSEGERSVSDILYFGYQ